MAAKPNGELGRQLGEMHAQLQRALDDINGLGIKVSRIDEMIQQARLKLVERSLWALTVVILVMMGKPDMITIIRHVFQL